MTYAANWALVRYEIIAVAPAPRLGHAIHDLFHKPF